jgi:hypothetical protein
VEDLTQVAEKRVKIKYFEIILMIYP